MCYYPPTAIKRRLLRFESQTLEEAGITATLVGGAAVSIHSDNEHQSMALDFVTAAMRGSLVAALAPHHRLAPRYWRKYVVSSGITQSALAWQYA